MEEDGFREDGRPSYWVSLKPGYNWQGCSGLHEGTVKKLLRAMADVEEGDPY